MGQISVEKSCPPGSVLSGIQQITGSPVTASGTYTFSVDTKLVGGSMANITTFELAVATYTSASAIIGTAQGTAFTPGTTRARQSFTTTVASNAAYARPQLYMVFGAGTVNATIRFYDPVLEIGAFAGTIIRPAAGTIAAATRGGDDLRLSLQSAWLDGVANTILIEATIPQAAPSGQDQGLLRLDDGTDSNKFCLVNVAGGTSVHAQLTLGGTLVSDLSLGAMVVGAPFRAIAGYSLVVGNGMTAGIVSGGNRASGAPTVSSVPTFTRALVGRSSLYAGRAIEESARHANGQIAEIMIAKGVVLDENTMLYMSQMNLTVGALLTNSGVILGGS